MAQKQRKRKLTALQSYYLIRIIHGLMFTLMATVSAVYRVDVVNLNALQLVLVGTTLELAFFVAEVPTGVVADVFSRKLSVIIGYFVVGLGFVVEGLFPVFAMVLVAQVVWGVGYTFISGAESAWLADEIGEETLAKTQIRGAQITSGTAILGILLAMSIGSYNLGLAFVVSGLGFCLLAILLHLFMPEEGFTQTSLEDRDNWTHLFSTFKEGLRFVRKNRMIQLIFWIEVCVGLASEGIDRLEVAHLLESFTLPAVNIDAIVWVSILAIILMTLNIIFGEILRRQVDESNVEQILKLFRAVFIAFIVAVTLFAFSIDFKTGAITMVMMQLFRRLAFPIYDAWVNKQIDSNLKATVLSMWGQTNAIGQMIGGPFVGIMATIVSYKLGFVVVALFLLPIPFLISLGLRWHKTGDARA